MMGISDSRMPIPPAALPWWPITQLPITGFIPLAGVLTTIAMRLTVTTILDNLVYSCWFSCFSGDLPFVLVAASRM